MTKHCEERAIQRGLTDSAIDMALKYGEVYEQKGGASLVKLTKRQRKALMKELKNLMRILNREQDMFLVVGDDGSLVTAGWQNKRIRHNQ
jgi:NAD kinase